jgi:hypothetical protein
VSLPEDGRIITGRYSDKDITETKRIWEQLTSGYGDNEQADMERK